MKVRRFEKCKGGKRLKVCVFLLIIGFNGTGEEQNIYGIAGEFFD